jgi:hypothetical protein
MTARIVERGRGGLVAGVTGLALLAGGCGGAANAPLAGGAAATTGRLIAYSSCMRAHGVPSFPDPDSHGDLILGPGAGIDPSSPRYLAAEQACSKLRAAAAGSGMTPAQHAQALARLTQYVSCMRKRGIPMADPFSGPNGGVGIAIPRGVDLSSQTYKQAEAVCGRLLPKG